MMSVNNALRRIFSGSRYNQSKFRNLCSSVATSRDIKQTSPDILLNKFKYANNTTEVLDTFSLHKDVMNSRHVMQALRSVFILQREGRSDLSTKSIINSKKFAQLCGKLKRFAGTYDSQDTIEALKVVTYVGVPANSTIVQVLLQLLRHRVNDLNLQQIIFLEFLLGQYNDVPLAEALKIALPIVFDIQLPIKMHGEHVQNLRECLQFASKHQLSEKSVDLIVSKLLNCSEKYDAKIAKSIVWSLSDLQPRPGFEPLLKKNLEILEKDVDKLTFIELDMTLKKVAQSYTQYRYPYLRNERFLNSFVDHVMEKNLGFEDSVSVIRKLIQFSWTSRAFIDYTSSKLLDMNYDVDFFSYFILLKYLAKTDYRPKNWDKILDKIKSMEVPVTEPLDLVQIAVILSYHQIFKEEIISKVFNQGFGYPLKKNVLNVFLTLYQSIKTYAPELTPKNFNPEEFLEMLSVPKEFPLEGALYSAFGGGNYVKSGLYSKQGIFIDHVIQFRRGGYPVSTNFTSKFIEDQTVPEDNEMVLVMCLPPEAYTEERYLRKTFAIKLKLLETLGYTVVPICWDSWNSLLDYEKIPYLVQNIKNNIRQDQKLNGYA